MNKDHIIKKNYEYEKIINSNKSYKIGDYVIFLEIIQQGTYRFGISVGKKIGNAVIRNKIKRQLKSILAKQKYSKTFNCVIIVKKSILNKKYNKIENDIINILLKLNLKELIR